METANKILSDTLYAMENKNPLLKKICRVVIELGSVGTFLSIAFLWVFTYLGYYTLTGMSLGDIVSSPTSNKSYLFLGFLFYILHIVYDLTYVNSDKICKKYKVAVIK